MKNRTQARPDRGWSWIIVSAAFFNCFVLAGIVRGYSVLFVEIIDEFQVTRKEAAWPITLCVSVRNLVGLITGPLGQRFGVRPVTIVGSLVATIGISSCYLTNSLDVINILFGVIYGIGYGLIGTLTCVIVSEYFLNYRTLAIGIANSGSCIGSIIFPILFEYLITKYGLSGCFLLTGGLVLHITITGALMRPPLWLQKIKSTSCLEANGDNHSELTGLLLNDRVTDRLIGMNLEEKSKFSSSLKTYGATNLTENIFEEKRWKPLKDLKESQSKGVESQSMENKLCSNGKGVNTDSSILNVENEASPEKKPSFQESGSLKLNVKFLKNRSYTELTNELDLAMPVRRSSKTNVEISCENINVDKSSSVFRRSVEKLLSSTMFTHTDGTSNASEDRQKHSPEENVPKLSFSILKSFRKVLTNSMFYITAINAVCFYTLFHMYTVIIADYSLDRGIPNENIESVLSAFAVSDFFGRLCLGWITDRKLLRRSHYVMGCMILIGLTFFSFSFATNYTWLMIISCLYGLLQGCTMVVFPVLIVDYVGLELQAIAIGCLCFSYGVASFARPLLIGYFRDTLGSYSNIFYMLGSIAVVSSFLWPLERYFVKNDGQKT